MIKNFVKTFLFNTIFLILLLSIPLIKGTEYYGDLSLQQIFFICMVLNVIVSVIKVKYFQHKQK